MNQDNSSRPPATEPLAKRRRGRPRKDESTPPKEKQSNYLKNIIHQVEIKPVDDNANQDNVNQDNQNEILGQQVSGVIEGSFDSGYLLAVKMPPDNTVLRGVVFHPGRVSSVTSVNDIAPLVKMHTRKEVAVENVVLPENVNLPEIQSDENKKENMESENKNLANMERVVDQNQNQKNQNQFELDPNPTFPIGEKGQYGIGNSFITMMTSDSSFPAGNSPFVLNQESQSASGSCLGGEQQQQQTLERLFSPHLQQNREGIEDIGVGVGGGGGGGERLMEESDRREVVEGIEGEGKGIQDQESGGGIGC